MKNNLRIALYVLVFVLSMSLWNRWNVANMPPPATEASAPTISAESPQTAKLVHVKTDVMELWINRSGGEIVRADLLTYPQEKNNSVPLSLLKTENPARFIFQSGLIGDNAPPPMAEYVSEKSEYQLDDALELVVPLTWTNDAGVKVFKTFTFKRGSFAFDLQQKVDNQSTVNWNGFAYERFLFGKAKSSSSLGQVATFTGGVFSTPKDHYQKISLGDMNKRVQSDVTDTGWAALLQHYFLGAIIPEAGTQRLFFTNAANDEHFIGTSRPSVDIAAGQSATFNSQIYIGPKIQQDLKQIAPHLDQTVDYGWLFMIGKPMFVVLNLIHSILGNWGWSIIVMTLLIKGLFFVPSAWAYKSMAGMRRIAPEMQLLKERYGDDRQGMGQAVMALYKREKINPASGCLPMLLQIPFFLAFYWVLVESVELRHASWIAWLNDLSAMDPYFVLPVINAALMYYQQKLNPPPTDPTQAKVMQMLPLIFGVMFMWFPSGLVLYWTVSNAFSIVQQRIMNKKYSEQSNDKKGQITS